MESRADAVIIGAGIMGTSVAYRLAQRDFTDVVVLERAFVGGGTTGLSAAMIMHQTGIEATTRLARLSIQDYLSVSKQIKGGIGLHQVESILFATNDQAAEQIRNQAEMQGLHGIETALISGSDLRTMFPPFVKTDDILVASHCPWDGYIDPYIVTLEFAGRADELGVAIHRHSEATGLVMDGKRVKGVEVGNSVIETDIVINAAGGLAREVASWAGVDLPVTHSIRNIAQFTPRPAVDEFPIIEDIVTKFYFRPEVANVLVGVGPETELDGSPENLAPDYDTAHDEALFEFLSARAPDLTEVPFRGGWAGVRSLTPDEVPILGPVDDVEGLINCCGFSGFGITLAPIVGRVIAEFVADGTTGDIDIEPFLLKRFQAD